MRKLLNTLYVTTQGSYVHRDGETVVIEQEQKKILQVPIHMISSIVCFGNVLCSPALLGFCAERSVSIAFLTEYGHFLASVNGPTTGNVLLRRNQYRMADSEESCRNISANIVAAKCANCRLILHRGTRDHGEKIDTHSIKMASSSIERLIGQIDSASDTDAIRGIEGMAAAEYFAVFNQLIVDQKDAFMFNDRNRRPLSIRSMPCSLSSIPFLSMIYDPRSKQSASTLQLVFFTRTDQEGQALRSTSWKNSDLS
jgi:CRISPR-associated endonuclease Cas1